MTQLLAGHIASIDGSPQGAGVIVIIRGFFFKCL